MKVPLRMPNPVALWRKCGFITRQCIVVGICSTMVMTTLSVLVLWYARRSMTDNLCRLVMSSVRNHAAKLESDLRLASHFTQDLAIALEYGDYTDAELWSLLERQLKVQRDHAPAVHGGSIAFLPTGPGEEEMRRMFYVHFEDGREEKRLLGGSDDRYWSTKWFAAARDTAAPTWSEPYFDLDGSKMLMVTCRVPFYRKGPDGGRQFAGVVSIDLEVHEFREMIQAHEIVAEGYSALISRSGSVITHPDPRLSGRHSIFDAVKIRPEVADVVREIQNGKDAILRADRTTILNEEVLYFLTPIPESKWMLLAAFPTRLIYERLDFLLWMLVAGSLGGLILLVSLTSLMLRNTGTPLRQLEQVALRIGEGDFSTPLPYYPAADEIGRLNHSIALMQQELQNRLERLARSMAVQEGLEHELQIARKIQQTLLPVFLPPLPECREFTLAAQLIPARMVSGDLYDIFMLDEHRIALVIGDVSGKGVPAALLMAVVQTFQHCAACKCEGTGKMVTCLNSMLGKNNPNVMFITYFIGIVDLRTGVMRYTNAGHNPPVLIRADGVLEELSTVNGLPVGMSADEVYLCNSIALQPGDGIFAYTDGVNEAENPADDQFGAERLHRTLGNCAAESPAAILAEVNREVAAFADGREFSDDVTMWCFKLKAVRGKDDVPRRVHLKKRAKPRPGPSPAP